MHFTKANIQLKMIEKNKLLSFCAFHFVDYCVYMANVTDAYNDFVTSKR